MLENWCADFTLGHRVVAGLLFVAVQFIFKTKQLEYQDEGIRWEHIEFPDNQDVLDLIDSKRSFGLLTMLDEQSMVPRGSDQGFLAAIAKQSIAHPRCVCGLSAASRRPS